MDFSLLMIGCGNMGGALLDGWLKAGLKAKNTLIIDPSEEIKEKYKKKDVKVISSYDEDAEKLNADITILAVKPQIMDKVLSPIKEKIINKNSVIISIAAGMNRNWYENIFSKSSKIVRFIPNTPAQVNKGMTLAIKNSNVEDKDVEKCNALLDAVGEKVWLKTEDLMNPATAISGSGPAFVFYFVEALAMAGVMHGLDLETSKKLAKEMVIGSAELLKNSKEDASELRKKVTSKGGTTEQSLNILMSTTGFRKIFYDVIDANVKRSKELSNLS